MHTTTQDGTRSVRVGGLWPLFLGGFLTTYLLSVANVSIPDIQATLSASSAAVSLVLGGYAAAFAAGLIICGRLGDRYGRRRLFVIGAAAAVLTSLAVLAAPTIGTLVGARAAQGLASAALLPQAAASIQGLLRGPDRARALGMFAAWTGLGNILGQGIGGLVIGALPDGYGWRGAMGTVTVIAVIVLIGSTRLAESRSPARPGLDLVGSVLVGTSLLLVVAGFSLGPSLHWPTPVVGCLALGLAGLVVLAAQQRAAESRGRPTVLPPSVTRLPAVRNGMLLAALMFAGFAGVLYAFAITTQQALGMSAFASGSAVLGLMVGFVAFSMRSTRLVARWGPRRVMVVGGLVQAAGWLATGLLAWIGPDLLALWLQAPFLVVGASYGLLYAPLIGAVMAAVPTNVAGLTGGLVSTAQQAGYGIGVALLSGLFVALRGAFSTVEAFGVLAAALTPLGLALAFIAGRIQRAESNVWPRSLPENSTR